MQIFYNDITTLHNFIYSENFSSVNPNADHESIKRICNDLFNTKEYDCAIDNSINYWNYLLLNKFSNESQFDVIDGLISENVDIPDKFLFAAEKGDRFHGFRNRPWKTEEGNIHLTFFLKPNNSFENIHAGMLIVAAVSVLRTIDQITDLAGKAKTKWVNDITIDGAKVCGIITKSYSLGNKLSGVLIGIGLNVLRNPSIDPDIFTHRTTSLKDELKNKKISFISIFENLLENLSDSINLLEDGGYDELFKFYRDRSDVIGKNVFLFSDGLSQKKELLWKGKVLDINDKLELIFSDHEQPFRNGRLSFMSRD